ncbi:MAG: B12-binding domain-containing radical SAM protein [bacterium]|nr:B12-binding domain-containing radical SAM protein [bacterium]
MTAFNSIALLQSHQRVPPLHDYYISDLIELCGLAAVVREQVDDIAIPVTPTDRDPLGAFERFMSRRRPELVGISCFTCGAKSALEYARIAKQYNAVVLTGGYHPSALPEEMLESPHIDVVVRGEGERTFEEIVRGDSLDGINGISYRSNGAITHNSDRELIDDLDSLPLPIRELRPPRFGLAGLDYHVDTVYASRGCRGKCSFCANHLVGKRWRQRSNEAVVAELLTIPPPRSKPWKIVKFWDPSFMADADHVEELCDLILEHGLERHFRFISETRAEDVVRARGILAKMRRAGFVRVGCGIESPNRETHKLLHKGLNLEHVQKAADLLTDNDIMFSKFLILGHPNEGVSDVLEYGEYSLSHGVKLQNTNFMVMTPYPGTETARTYKEQGLTKSFDWDLYNNFGAVVAPNEISTLELQGLLCTVGLRYAIDRRFLLRKSAKGVLLRVFEGVFLHSRMALANSEYSRSDVEGSLHRALAMMEGRRERASDSSNPQTSWDRLTLCFHYKDCPTVQIGIIREGDEDVLEVTTSSLSISSGRRNIHLSIRQLVTLVERIDLRRGASDFLTLAYSPRAFKLGWLPGLCRNLGTLVWALLKMTGFHLKTALFSR